MRAFAVHHSGSSLAVEQAAKAAVRSLLVDQVVRATIECVNAGEAGNRGTNEEIAYVCANDAREFIANKVMANGLTVQETEAAKAAALSVAAFAANVDLARLQNRLSSPITASTSPALQPSNNSSQPDNSPRLGQHFESPVTGSPNPILPPNNFQSFQPNIQNVTKLVPNSTSVTSSNFLTYENTKLGIKIQYPSNWTKAEASDGIRFASPLENSKDKYQETFDIFVYPPSNAGNLPLNQIISTIIKDRQSSLKDFHLDSSNQSTIVNGTVVANMIVYTYNDPDARAINAMDIVAKITNSGKRTNSSNTYLVSFNADAAKYWIYFPIVQRMIDSINLSGGTDAR